MADYKELYERANAQNRELREENAILKAAADGDHPDAYWRMQGKIARQRQALDVLNRKVLSQRFRLRTIAEMGRDLTADEYQAAKNKLENVAVKARILDFEPVG